MSRNSSSSEEDVSGSRESSSSSFSSDDDLTSADPVATEEEQAEYARQFALEEEEENEFAKRFNREVGIETWCICSNCSLDNLVKAAECRCCHELEKIREKISDEGVQCIAEHEGFKVNCLNRYVLEVAGIGLKTKYKKSYITLLRQERCTQSEFYRAVGYRQFVRFIWSFLGASTRFPLPACVYEKIRKEFPDKNFHGFEEAEDEDSEENDS